MQSAEKIVLKALVEEIVQLRRAPHSPPTRREAPAVDLACARCGEAATSALIPFGQSWRERVLVCRPCYPIIRRAMIEPEYQLTEADHERAQQEIEERAMSSGRLTTETETLVIDGTNIRFKTPKEFLAQYGMPKEFDQPLKMLHEEQPVNVTSDDPFDFGGDAA